VSTPADDGIDTVKMTKKAKVENKCHTEDVIEFIGWCVTSTYQYDILAGVSAKFTCAHHQMGTSRDKIQYVVGEADTEGHFYLYLTQPNWTRRTDVEEKTQKCFYADGEWITRSLVELGVLSEHDYKFTMELVNALFPQQYQSPTSPVRETPDSPESPETPAPKTPESPEHGQEQTEDPTPKSPGTSKYDLEPSGSPEY